MDVAVPPYELRWSRRASVIIWLIWLALAAAAFLPALSWHLDYAREHYPLLFWPFAGALLFLAFILPPLHQRLRLRGLLQYEPAGLAALGLTAAIVYQPLAALVGTAVFLAAYCSGRYARERFLRLSPESSIADIVTACGIGFGLLCIVLMVMGLVGLYNVPAFVLVLAGLILPFYGQIQALWRDFGVIQQTWAREESFRGPLVGLAVVLAAVLIVSAMMVILAPSILFDPLAFHLPLAQNYVEHASLTPLVSDHYGYNPQAVEMLMALGLALAGQPGAQIIPPIFFLLTVLALYSVGRACRLERAPCFVGCVLGASVPFIHVTGIAMKNDLAVAFFQLTGLLTCLYWQRDGEFRWIQLGVFLAAISLWCKLPAAFGVAGLGVLFIYAAFQQVHRIRAFASCALIVLLVGPAWAARTYLLTGDPLYPADPVHPGGKPSASHRERPSRVYRLFRVPYLAHFRGDFTFQADTRNPAGTLLLLTVPLWLLLRRQRYSPAARACLIYGTIHYLCFSFTYPILRFAIALVLLLVMFVTARLIAWFETEVPTVRRSLHGAVAFNVMFSLCVLLILEVTAPQFLLYTRQIDEKEYLRRALLTYPSLEALARHAGPDDKVYSPANCSRAYAPYPDSYYCRLERVDPDEIPDFNRMLNNLNARFLILSTRTDSASVPELGKEAGSWDLLHEDAHFLLYERAGAAP